MIEQILNIAIVYAYVSIPIIALISLMVLSWILAISVREDGTVYISKGSLFYKFRLAMIFPMVTLIALPELRSGWNDYVHTVKGKLDKYTIVSNLCKIFWSSVFSVLVLIPLNLVLLCVAICLIPFALILWVFKFLVIGLIAGIIRAGDRGVKTISSAKTKISEKKLYENNVAQFARSQYSFIKESMVDLRFYYSDIGDRDVRYSVVQLNRILSKIKELYILYNRYQLIAADIDAVDRIIARFKSNRKKTGQTSHIISDAKMIKIIDSRFYEKYQIAKILDELLLDEEKSRERTHKIRQERIAIMAARKRKKDMLKAWYRKWLCPEIKVVE